MADESTQQYPRDQTFERATKNHSQTSADDKHDWQPPFRVDVQSAVDVYVSIQRVYFRSMYDTHIDDLFVIITDDTVCSEDGQSFLGKLGYLSPWNSSPCTAAHRVGCTTKIIPFILLEFRHLHAIA